LGPRSRRLWWADRPEGHQQRAPRPEAKSPRNPSSPALPTPHPPPPPRPQFAGSAWNVSITAGAPRVVKRYNAAATSPLFTTSVTKAADTTRRYVAGTVRVTNPNPKGSPPVALGDVYVTSGGTGGTRVQAACPGDPETLPPGASVSCAYNITCGWQGGRGAARACFCSCWAARKQPVPAGPSPAAPPYCPPSRHPTSPQPPVPGPVADDGKLGGLVLAPDDATAIEAVARDMPFSFAGPRALAAAAAAASGGRAAGGTGALVTNEMRLLGPGGRPPPAGVGFKANGDVYTPASPRLLADSRALYTQAALGQSAGDACGDYKVGASDRGLNPWVTQR
jgi:hypothetical protein